MADAITAAGGASLLVQADATTQEGVRKVFASATRKFGAVDIAVLNVGLYKETTLAAATEADFNELFGANTRSVVFGVQECAKAMREGGRIITISSSA